MKRIRPSDHKIMPWKNGRGQTAEIDRFPAGDGPYLWRLSQAPITGDGEFSLFPGFDRWLAVWKGGAIALNGRRVEPLEPFRFSGDEQTLCRLESGPVTDVGLIFDRSRVEADMRLIEGEVAWPTADAFYLFDLQSGDTMKLENDERSTVPRGFLISIRLK